MELVELGLTPAEITKLNNKGFHTVEDIQTFFPRKYYDFSEAKPLDVSYANETVAVVGLFNEIQTDKKNGKALLKAKVIEKTTGNKLHVLWIGNYYMKKVIENFVNEDVVVCGKLTYSAEYKTFHMCNPIVFSNHIESKLRIMPVYKKMTGIGEEWMDKMLRKSLDQPYTDFLPAELEKKYKLLSGQDMLNAFHAPSTMEELRNAEKRYIFDDMLHFACDIEAKDRSVSKGSQYNIKSTYGTNKYIKSLPFKLSESQLSAYETMRDMAVNGQRVNSLVQGDVGSGKTVVAFLMMMAMADSGYQSVLMAPTEILASQHYEKLSVAAEKLGYTCAFLHGTLKSKEKKSLYGKIKEGKINFIVGTQSVFSKDVEYKDLALIVVDEEHRFGVEQRRKLTEKAQNGVHSMLMSATPIPRTVANTIYRNSIQVFDLERPAGRQEVQTAIYNVDKKIFEFEEKQIANGRQIYVVCPLIESGDGDALSVEETAEMYNDYFKKNPNIKIGCVTGKMKKDASDEMIAKFKDGEIQILISTTVIEVGVDVPNASTIVINNAERFGLAQLHQLRGRVGRGKYKGYCILKSADKENERLNLLCRSNNGYELALEDVKLRGPGDLLGSEQSGANRSIELILKYPNMYKVAQKEAVQLVNNMKY